jgi:hypothetical protein
MYLGTALTLFAVGAILTFAVTSEPFDFISLDVVGIILMLVGLVGAILELAIWRPRRTTTVGATREVVRERDVL